MFGGLNELFRQASNELFKLVLNHLPVRLFRFSAKLGIIFELRFRPARPDGRDDSVVESEGDHVRALVNGQDRLLIGRGAVVACSQVSHRSYLVFPTRQLLRILKKNQLHRSSRHEKSGAEIFSTPDFFLL